MTSILRTIAHVLSGQVVRIALQAGFFVVLARELGAHGFGAFTSVVALTAIVVPFSSLGTNLLMVRSASRDRGSVAAAWQRAFVLTVMGGLVVALALMVFAPLVAPDSIDRRAVFLIAIADLVGLKLVETAAACWQAVGEVRPLVVLPAVANALRLGAAVALVTFGSDIGTWSMLYALASVPFGLVVAFETSRRLGWVRTLPRISRPDLALGAQFAVGVASQTTYNDVDKVLLGKLGSAADAGLYAAASRLVDMACTPLRSVAAAMYPDFFRTGAGGLRSALHLVRRIAPLVLGYGVVAAAALALAAPLVPVVLGPSYAESAGILPLMAIVVVTRSVNYLASDALTGADRQGYRTSVQVTIAVLNIVSNVLLIPRFGVSAAVGVTLACEVVLGVALWLGVAVLARTERLQGPVVLAAEVQRSRA